MSIFKKVGEWRLVLTGVRICRTKFTAETSISRSDVGAVTVKSVLSTKKIDFGEGKIL